MPTHAIEPFPSRQFINVLGCVTALGLLGYGYYLEYGLGLFPCPLCVIQRAIFFTLALVFLIAALHNPMGKASRIYALLILLVAGGGAGVAGYQAWMQRLPPDQVPECGPGLAYMLDTFTLSETVRAIFTASGECSDVAWTFLDLSIADWALVMFVSLGLMGFIRNMIVRKNHSV